LICAKNEMSELINSIDLCDVHQLINSLISRARGEVVVGCVCV
jgi:hypothetical protein